jgi:predicted Zn-dependent protease with MMP-like domain
MSLAENDAERHFENLVGEAVDAVPAELRSAISNVELVVEDEPPPGQNLLGLYQGYPLTVRTSAYSGALPDRISIYRGPLERLYGHDPELLRREVRRVVWHELAHHFGISDDRLVELGRY